MASEGEFLEIGLFQLENLTLNPNRFLFFDLRDENSADKSLAQEVDRLLKQAERRTADGLLNELKAKSIPFEFPIVLLCEDGRSSKAAAQKLLKLAYSQVYVVSGGVAGLLSEL